jgi:hypothetical protein
MLRQQLNLRLDGMFFAGGELKRIRAAVGGFHADKLRVKRKGSVRLIHSFYL